MLTHFFIIVGSILKLDGNQYLTYFLSLLVFELSHYMVLPSDNWCPNNRPPTTGPPTTRPNTWSHDNWSYNNWSPTTGPQITGPPMTGPMTISTGAPDYWSPRQLVLLSNSLPTPGVTTNGSKTTGSPQIGPPDTWSSIHLFKLDPVWIYVCLRDELSSKSSSVPAVGRPTTWCFSFLQTTTS